MSDRVDDVLAHYGIVGMKWGKRTGSVSKAKKTPLTDRQIAARNNRRAVALLAVVGTIRVAGAIAGSKAPRMTASNQATNNLLKAVGNTSVYALRKGADGVWR